MGTTGRDAEPDDIAYDADKERLEEQGIETRMEGAVLSDEQIAEMWLRQIDPSPARFLQRKFAFQLGTEQP